MVKKVLTGMFLFAALGIYEANAQLQVYIEPVKYANNVNNYDDNYHYETRERRVWIPEQRVPGLFGIGTRTIPGHYEIRTERIKVYDNQYNKSSKGWEGKHPHGMPPGQRKKMDKYNNRDYRSDDNNQYKKDHNKKGRD